MMQGPSHGGRELILLLLLFEAEDEVVGVELTSPDASALILPYLLLVDSCAFKGEEPSFLLGVDVIFPRFLRGLLLVPPNSWGVILYVRGEHRFYPVHHEEWCIDNGPVWGGP